MKQPMQRKYIHYTKWEDWKNGMYQTENIIDRDKKVIASIMLLSSPEEFYQACKDVVENWVYSTTENLSNQQQNRRAWLGAAACLIRCNAPEVLTRIAWKLLNEETQNIANAVADKIINIYENKHTNIYQNVGESLLF
jgi:hypothetical protein